MKTWRSELIQICKYKNGVGHFLVIVFLISRFIYKSVNLKSKFQISNFSFQLIQLTLFTQPMSQLRPNRTELRSMDYYHQIFCRFRKCKRKFPPKNEWKQVDLRYHSSKVELFRSFFVGNRRHKKPFEIIWPLDEMKIPQSYCLSKLGWGPIHQNNTIMKYFKAKLIQLSKFFQGPISYPEQFC